MVVSCEQYANDATTTLTVAVTLLDTTITVSSALEFPVATPFRVMIDNEIMMVTLIAVNVFTVTRGLENTPTETHENGSEVAQVLTNGGLCAFSECRFATDTRANLPSPGLDGRLFFTQTPGWYLYRENGAAWRAWGPIFQLNEGIDFDNDEWGWTNVNDGVNPPAGLTGIFGELVFAVAPNVSPGENVRLFTEAVNAEIPASPPYTVTTAFIPLLAPVNQTYCGIVFRDSVSGKFIFFKLMYDDTSITKRDIVISIDKYDDPNTLNSSYKTLSGGSLLSPMVWFRMSDDSVNLKWYFSNDGFNFTLIDSVSRTNFLSSGPDEIGIAFGTNNTTGSAGINLNSWLKG